jgi:DNA polymerase-3 subunit epsilon
MTRRIAIDIETSGLNPNTGAEVVMICALELRNDMQSGAAFQKLSKPTYPLTLMAEELTGISNSALEHSLRFADVADDLLTFVGNAELVCLDWKFVSLFLNLALANSGRPPLQSESVLDLWDKVPVEFRGQGSDGVFSYAGVERNPAGPPSGEISRLYQALIEH